MKSKPVGVILDFERKTVEYVTPSRAAKAGAPTSKQENTASRTGPAARRRKRK